MFFYIFDSISNKFINTIRANKQENIALGIVYETVNLHLNQDIQKIAQPKKIRDERAIRLEKYLLRQRTELYKYSDLIIELSDKYNINYKIPVAIAGVESGFCRINFKPNNCWGYGQYSWTTLEIAIIEYYRLMNIHYFSKGRKTVESISAIYNPYPKEYSQKLYFFIHRIP